MPRSFPVPPDSYITKTMSQPAAGPLLSGRKKTILISCLKKTTAGNLTIIKGAENKSQVHRHRQLKRSFSSISVLTCFCSCSAEVKRVVR